MRRLLVAVLVLFLATPVWAQTSNGNMNSSPTTQNFGRMNCPQPVPCPGDAGQPMSSSQLAAQASACVTQYFGYANSGGFFDTSSGLDSNGCLSTIPNILPKGVGSQLAPSCCVAKMSSGSCAFHCELNTVP